MRRWLLAAVLILTIVDCFGQMKRYDTDFFVSQRDFLVAVPLEVERGQFYITLASRPSAPSSRRMPQGMSVR